MPGAKDRLIRATAWHAAGRVAAGVLGLANAAWAFQALRPEQGSPQSGQRVTGEPSAAM